MYRAIAIVGCGLLAGAPVQAQPQTQAEADAELRAMADEAVAAPDETIIIYDERPDKPFDRDTDVRLTGEQLAARGATDLASALRLLPDVNVRDGGRGGFNVDIRGGRKGAVVILVDGVSVTDPYYGTFDVSSIPITDIVQIRVSSSPASPIDGPGGSGGVIEVLTRDAIGPQVVVARVNGDSLPSFGIGGTARAALAKHLALRISGNGQFGSREHPLVGKATLDEGRKASTGSARLEYRKGERRVVLDGFLDSRHYVPPPSDTEKSDIVMIDRELSARVSAKADDKIDKLQLQGQFWTHYLSRLSRTFSTFDLETQTKTEDLEATRVGGMALATHPIGKRARWATSFNANSEQARVVDHVGTIATGETTMLQLAGDLQYEYKRLRLDAALGAAVPVNLDTDPWPEGKLVARYRPYQALELIATGGYKGRIPSLRERFDPETGNATLDPEKTWHAELRGVHKADEHWKLEVAAFVRRARGTIRNVPAPTETDPTALMSENLDRVRFSGVETSVRGQLHPMVEAGASYQYIRARSNSEDPLLAADPLDRLPAHRADAWVQLSPSRRLVMMARVRYFGESIDRQVEVPGYTLLEATLTSPITDEYLAVLRVDDATDVAPETRMNYHAPGRVISLVVQGSWQ